ncbi:hypothetical protein [Paraburkholderia bonniea]|uniref:hypothetical protein n=1 Tax=Paraburkholderia bonniea TaxID=2152891 RepID=UPI0012923415|nr:hypothetical protein [Paraburkholderia bonniea]
MSLSSLRIPGFNNNGIVTGNESPQNSNPATSSSYSSNLRAALTDTYKLVSGKIFAEETPAPKCNRATQTDIKFGVNLKALIEYNINPEANSTRNAQPAGKLPIIENQDTILKILSENSTQSDLANYSKISHDTQTLLKNYTPKNSKNNKKLEINFDEIIKYEINQKLNTARRASYIKNTVNNITKETLPYIESINIINAIFNPKISIQKSS